MLEVMPEKGMKVTVDRNDCCYEKGHPHNHTGKGVITDIDKKDSFLVKMDDYDEEWWRCSKCVSLQTKEAP